MSTPLYDIAAEDNLVGGILNGGDINEVSAMVQATDLYGERNALIFGAAISVFNTSQQVSPATVATQLRRDGHSEITETTLNDLRSQAMEGFSEAYVVTYAQNIREHSQNRQLERKLQSALRTVGDPKLTPEEKLGTVQRDVMELATRRETREIADGRELAALVFDHYERSLNDPDGLMGESWGLTELDRMTEGLQGGLLYVVGGRPSMGKSQYGNHVASQVAFKTGKPTLIFSLEMSREQVGRRIAGCEAGVNTKKESLKNLRPEEKTRFLAAIKKLDTSPIKIDDTSALPLSELTAKARRLHHQAPLGVIVVDYLQLIDIADANTSRNLATLIGNISRGLKQLARELDVPVIALSQLSRSVESRPNKRPILSDLRDSGAVEQDADVVMFLYRDAYYNPGTEEPNVAEIIIAKQRDGEVGTVKASFNPITGRFRDLAPSYVGAR